MIPDSFWGMHKFGIRRSEACFGPCDLLGIEPLESKIAGIPVKMVELVNAVLASSHQHIEITTELQNDHRWESPED